MEKSPPILMLIVVSSLCLFCSSDKRCFAAGSPGLAIASDMMAAIGKLQAASDTHFVAIDLAHVQTGAGKEGNREAASFRQPDGVEPSPFILWRNDVTSRSGIWIMTLDQQTGAQRGNRLNVQFTDSWHPVDVVWADHFSSSPTRGVEPTPWVVFRDYRLYTFPVTHSLDGTPVAGSPTTYLPVIDSTTYGHAVCAAELPGSEYADGQARLLIGTDNGYLVVLRFSAAGGNPVANFIHVSSEPIVNLQPLPQCGYIALGTITGDSLVGIRLRQPLPGPYATVFALATPPGATVPLDLDSLGPDDAVLPDCQSALRLVLADGTANLALVDIAANQTGVATLTPTLERHNFGIRSAVTGSLLMVTGDGSAVMFDPNYSQQDGSSGCDLNITDGIANQCYLCGDADGSGAISISDAVYLINYIFAGGPAPNPLLAGDADCSGLVTISDAVYLINYIFAGGSVPCAACP